MEYPSFAFTGIHGLLYVLLLVDPLSNADCYKDYDVFCDLYGNLDSSINGGKRERKPEGAALWGGGSLSGAAVAPTPNFFLAALFCMCAGGYGGKRGWGFGALGDR